MDELINGAIPDPRPAEEKLNDYTYEEYLGSGAIVWEEKTVWTALQKFYQSASSSCGGQAGAKALTAFVQKQMSASPIYRRRHNFPAQGMYMQDIGNILKKYGSCLEEDCPSQGMLEEQMNAVVVPETPFKISSYYNLPAGKGTNMDAIAQALEKGHALIFGVSSNAEEYTSIPKSNDSITTFSHFVATVAENYLLYQGEKAVVIDDSANAFSTLNGSGQRIFTESFIKSRVWGILALVPLKEVETPKPSYTFIHPLSFGMTRDKEVKILQDILKYEGVMPKTIPSTGNFLEATLHAVKKLQTKYADEILKPIGLKQGTGYVGTRTITWLNKRYGIIS